MTDTLFLKIIDREIPADIVYEDDQCLAFRDITRRRRCIYWLSPKN